MLSLLAEMARNEVEVLRERINSGLAQARREGVVLGRHKGEARSPMMNFFPNTPTLFVF
jgi:DNA invertase Pin-like site-specific DNA recombinase